MIAAVVVTHRAPAAMLVECVDALSDTEGLDEIVVVHNGEGDLPPMDGMVRVLRTPNEGFGAAVNAGIAGVPSAHHVVVLNDDVVVQPGWLSPLVDAVERSAVGAAQPVLVADDGRTVVSCGVRIDEFGAGADIGDGADAPPTTDEPQDLELFTGGALLLRADFLAAVGGFDERFFLYYEDVDLARRGAVLGWTYRLVPAARVVHRRGTTTARPELVERTRFLQERNRLWTAFRWSDPSTIGRACWLSLRRLRHEPRRIHARALAAGLAGAPRRVVERARAPRGG